MRKRIISMITIITLLTTMIPTVALGATAGAIASGGHISSVYVYTPSSSGEYTFTDGTKGTLKGHVSEVTADVGDRIVITGDPTRIYWCSNGASNPATPKINIHETEGTIDWYDYTYNSTLWKHEGKVTQINDNVYEDRNLNYNISVSQVMNSYTVFIGNMTIALENPRKLAQFDIGTEIKAISTNDSYSLLLTKSGEVYAMGQRKYPPEKVSISGIKAISVGSAHRLLLSESGEVYAMGSNNFGQLGLGDTTNRTTPTKLNISGIKAISVVSSGLLLTEEGEVYAMGDNYYGQLGLGDKTRRTTPTKLNISGIKAISAGNAHSLLLTEAGEVYAMGGNSYGQLGLGDTTNRTTPAKLNISGIKAISASVGHSLLLTESGEVYAMGKNEYGQLGLEDLELKLNEPVAIKNVIIDKTLHLIPTYTDVSDQIDESTFRYAFDKKYETPMKSFDVYRGINLAPNFNEEYKLRIYAKANWGPDINKVYTLNVINAPNNPPIVILVDVEPKLIFNNRDMYYLNKDGEVYASGENIYGELGVDSIDKVTTLTKVKGLDKVAVRDVITNEYSTWYLSENGEVYVSGYNGNLAFGIDDIEIINIGIPIKVDALDGVKIKDVVTDVNATWYISEKGEVYIAGEAWFGEESHWGTVGKIKSLEGVKIKEIIPNFNSGSVWYLSKDGQIYVSGQNDYGQLGVGTTSPVTTATKVSALEGVKIKDIIISNDGYSAWYLSEDGEVYVSGYSAPGYLGLGTTSPVITATKVPALDGVKIKDMIVSLSNTYYLSEDGEVYVCGRNDYGQLGIGTTEDVVVATKINSLEGIKIEKILKADESVWYLSEDGEVYVSGKNDYGQLGVGSAESVTTATKIKELKGVKDIIIGSDGSYAYYLTEDNKVYGSGYNYYDQLAQGDIEDQQDIVEIDELSGIKINKVLTFSDPAWPCSTIYLTEDGAVYVSGVPMSEFAEMIENKGFGSIVIPEGERIIDIIYVGVDYDMGSIFLVAESGTVYGFGQNTYGTLGEEEWYYVPTKIPGASLSHNASYPKVSKLSIKDEALSEVESSYYAFVSQSALTGNGNEVPDNLWVPFDINVPAVFLSPNSNDTYYLYVKLEYGEAEDGELVYRDGEKHDTILGPFVVTGIKGESDSVSYVTGDIYVRDGFNAEFNLVFIPAQDMTLGNSDRIFSNIFTPDKLNVELLDKQGNVLETNNKMITKVYKNGIDITNSITSNYVFEKYDSVTQTNNTYVLRVMLGGDKIKRQESKEYQIRFNGLKGLSIDGTNQSVPLNSQPFTMMVYVLSPIDLT